MTFFWADRIYGLFHITIKANGDGSEVWLSTFHKTTFQKFNAKIRNSKIIRGNETLTGGITAAR